MTIDNRKQDHQHLSESAIPAAQARGLILSGKAPANLRVAGHLNLSNTPDLVEVPAGLTAISIDLSGCTALRELPPGLTARRLDLSGCVAIQRLPDDLRCYELCLHGTRLRSLPQRLHVEYRLDLSDCLELEQLPVGLTVGSLILRNCVRLAELPERLDVYFLDISGCASLAAWPREASVRIGRLNAAGCTRLSSLPRWLNSLSQLDLRGCVRLADLPAELSVSAWIDLADTRIGWLPASARKAQLRWRGVPIDERIAFHPETITAAEILGEANAERRRVLLERMGYEAFLGQADAEVLDRDRDPGGERRLLRVRIPDDEPLVCVAVICPSTARQYLIRVPPDTRTCRKAAAWIAGFDAPDDYRPIMET